MAVSATLNLNFRSDEAKATISAWGMHIDFGPDGAFGRSSRSSSPWPTSTNGMSVVAGGAGGLPRALAAVAHSADAEPATKDQLSRSRIPCGLATAPWDEVRSASSEG
jgi:phytoene dehydrogenase-like protein